MKKKQKLYLVWNEPGSTDETGYYDQYASIEDAVSDHGDGTEVFAAEPHLIGRFRRKVAVMKIKARKKIKKKRG